jgi:hypothetical protein
MAEEKHPTKKGRKAGIDGVAAADAREPIEVIQGPHAAADYVNLGVGIEERDLPLEAERMQHVVRITASYVIPGA